MSLTCVLGTGKRVTKCALITLATWILAALLDGEKHGYAIGRHVEKRSDGDVRIAVGNLYVTLQRLHGLGWIEEVRRVEDAGGRRRVYRLTGLGEAVLLEDRDRALRRLSDIRRLREQRLRPVLAGL